MAEPTSDGKYTDSDEDVSMFTLSGEREQSLLATKVRPGNEPAFVAHLDSPGRVMIRIAPDARIGFDSEAMFANSPAGATNTEV